MTAKQYSAAMTALGLPPQGQQAKFLGVALRTAHGYANGSAVPLATAKLLRLMVHLGLSPADVRQESNRDAHRNGT